MVKNYIMIKELLNNETFVKKLEQIAQEFETIKEGKGDFSFFLPKFILCLEGLMKIYHPKGSNTFDYVVEYEKLREIKNKVWKESHEELVFKKVVNKLAND
jgi:hypothetical protein